jgi:rod shape-determining protein MreC
MQRKFQRPAVLFLLITSPFWLASFVSSCSSSFRTASVESISPVLRVFASTRDGFSHLFSAVTGVFSMEEENRLLRLKLETLESHEPVHQSLSAENARLRNLLDFKKKSGWPTVGAQVIGRDLGPWSRTLLIDRGQNHRIRDGMAVITPAGFVGRVTQAGKTTSRVAVLTDPHSRVMAVSTKNRIFGLAMGNGGGQLVWTYLPLDAEIQEKQSIVTAGGKSFAPENIPIGTVRRIWQDPSQLYRTAEIVPAVELSGVEEVLVVLWSASDSP